VYNLLNKMPSTKLQNVIVLILSYGISQFLLLPMLSFHLKTKSLMDRDINFFTTLLASLKN